MGRNYIGEIGLFNQVVHREETIIKQLWKAHTQMCSFFFQIDATEKTPMTPSNISSALGSVIYSQHCMGPGGGSGREPPSALSMDAKI